MFGLSREDTRMNHTEYIEKWKAAMKDAYEVARQNISKSTDDGRSNMIEKYGSPLYIQVIECWYLNSQSMVVLENLGLIGSKKYIS